MQQTAVYIIVNLEEGRIFSSSSNKANRQA